jgi:hypothetical protein
MQINTLDGSNALFRGRLSRGYRAVRFVLILVQSSPSVVSCPGQRREETIQKETTNPARPPQPPQLEKRQKNKEAETSLPREGGPSLWLFPRCSLPRALSGCWAFSFPGPPRWMGKRRNCSATTYFTVRRYESTIQKYKSTHLTTQLN